MTNGNDPVVQTVYRQTGTDSYRPATQKEINEGIYLVHKEGMTKRELMALTLHAALLGRGEHGYSNEEGNAQQALRETDALIAELNKQL